MKTVSRSGLLVVCVFMAAVEWLAIASDYKDSVFLGTYHLQQGSESSILVLKTDQTFQQDVIRNGLAQRCTGTWRRTGEGVITFSRDFLPVAGQELGADGTSYGTLEKSLGLFPFVTMAQYHVLWYSRTDPAQASSMAGTYAGEAEGVPATLILHNDHTFEQTVAHAGEAMHAHGTWGLRENGDIHFSRDFLKTSGEPLSGNETASAWHTKGPYLQIKVAATPASAPPVFRKRLFP